MLAHFLNNHPYTLRSATYIRLSTKMSGYRHMKVEINIKDTAIVAEGPNTGQETPIDARFYAYIRVDNDDKLLRVCHGDLYHEFFQKIIWGPGMWYRLDVEDVSVPTILLRILLILVRMH